MSTPFGQGVTIKKDHNYKASLSMCTKVRVRALKAIIGDYKAQFGQIRDYLYETYMQNPSTVVKVKTTKVTDDKHVLDY